LADLDSRNGTRIDGRPVASPETLTVGQAFMVGRTTLRVTKA
jgi:pSer/pThr/pTyr-binding forkhead associated (FHA) protein